MGIIVLLSFQFSFAQQNNDQTNSSSIASAPVGGLKKGDSNAGHLLSDETPSSNAELMATFTKMYPTASQQQWFKMEKGYWVSFAENGRKMRAGFDLNGKFNYSVADCTIDGLPRALKSEIDKKYSGASLIDAIEIKAFNQVTYQVILEKNGNHITLKSDGVDVEKTKQVSNTK